MLVSSPAPCCSSQRTTASTAALGNPIATSVPCPLTALTLADMATIAPLTPVLLSLDRGSSRLRARMSGQVIVVPSAAALLISLSLLSSLGFAPPAAARLSAKRFLLGRSVVGRPIYAYRVGNPDSIDRELVVGCIHGNETAGIAIARRLERGSPTDLDLWIVPLLNPDGAAAGTRGNAHGVDLNRNFPWRWRRLSGRYYSGARPLSTRETRIAVRLIRRLQPQVSIWFHQPLDVVDRSGGGASVERRFAALVGLPLRRLRREPGSVVGWQNHSFPGTTAFVVELPARKLSAAAVGRFARAAIDVGRFGS